MSPNGSFITGETSWFGEPSARTLILGGDDTGIQTARKLMALGFDVALAGDFPAVLDIPTIPDSSVESVRGFVNHFEVAFRTPTVRITERFGSIVCAQPASLLPKFSDYGLIPGDLMVSLADFSPKMLSGELPSLPESGWRHVAFLCGLSGESEPSTLASVLECVEALQRLERVQTYIFTKNLKVAAAGLERKYRECRELGALIFKFDNAIPTFESIPEGYRILFGDPLLDVDMELIPDILVVDEEKRPPETQALLSAIPSSGTYSPFLKPDSTRFAGVLTPKAGIFAVGPARGVFSPELIRSDIEAVALALRYGQVADAPYGPAVVDEKKCAVCLTCVRMCPHGAIGIGKKAKTDPESCFRCGICVVECPMKAIAFESESVESSLKGRIKQSLSGRKQKSVLALLCSRSAAQAYSYVSAEIPAGVVGVTVPCAGAVGPEEVLEAFNAGAGAVLVAGCFKGNCGSVYGSTLAEDRLEQVKTALNDVGLDPRRAAMVQVAANTGRSLVEALKDMEKLLD
jgi:quinone-modifying oxidoreductase, subunit QmoB